VRIMRGGSAQSWLAMAGVQFFQISPANQMAHAIHEQTSGAPQQAPQQHSETHFNKRYHHCQFQSKCQVTFLLSTCYPFKGSWTRLGPCHTLRMNATKSYSAASKSWKKRRRPTKNIFVVASILPLGQYTCAGRTRYYGTPKIVCERR